jgi:hypothetical protein
MRLSYLAFLIILFVNCVFPQQKTDIDNIRSLYESFEYKEVIKLSDSLITVNGKLNKSDLTEILMMKAVSHYVLAEEPLARKCFIDMLKIDRHLELDSEKVSPKIVSLFNDVKNDFLHTIPVEQKFTDNKQEETNQITVAPFITKLEDQKKSIVRSFLFPGWGHLYSGDITKGAIISSAALINLGAMIYFIIDANSKENKYLNATSEGIIKTSYDTYNRSYKTRNILIATMIGIYAYAQIDFLFLGGDIISDNIKLGIGENGSDPDRSGVAFLFKLSF